MFEVLQWIDVNWSEKRLQVGFYLNQAVSVILILSRNTVPLYHPEILCHYTALKYCGTIPP